MKRINLFCSLLLGLIPFLYTLVRTNLIADIPSTDGMGVAGHIEWFDLINETIQAFLIVTLYTLLNGLRLCGIMFCCLKKSFYGKVFYEVG